MTGFDCADRKVYPILCVPMWETALLIAIFLPLLGVPLVAVTRRGPGWLALVFPVISTLCLAVVAAERPGAAAIVERPWVPSLGLNLRFLVDGLSLFYGLVVSAMGVAVFFYAQAYMGGSPRSRARFFATLLFFMGTMLGTVFSGSLLLLFVFWELTGIASFLLIGFFNDRPASRDGARMSLLVTAGTGLCLLAGLLLLEPTGSGELSPGRLNVVALLVLLGAFGKSAQVPFQFWLPNAMAAPTPVSAYLHSATMVKLGVFLTARMAPVLGGAAWWEPLLVAVGFASMLLGAWFALLSHDLKAILAWSTVSALGSLLGFYGLGAGGTVSGDYLQILSHVLYKAALFMVVGIVDHACHERDLRQLGGLGRRMPLVALAGVISAASMAGIPGTLGFVSKELLLGEAVAGMGGPAGKYALACITLSALLSVAVALRLGFAFFGSGERGAVVHPPSAALQAVPLLLALGTLAFGLFPGWLDRPLFALHLPELHPAVPPHYALWHGWNLPLAVTGCALAAGVALGAFGIRGGWRFPAIPAALRWENLFNRGYDALVRLCGTVTRATGAETPIGFLPIILLFLTGGVALAAGTSPRLPELTPGAPDFLRSAVALIMVPAVLGAILLRGWMAQLVSLSISGFLVSFYYVLYRAPDLALTQIFVETAVLVPVIFLLSRFSRSASEGGETPPSPRRWLNFAVAVAMGATVCAALLMIGPPPADRLGLFYMARTVPLAEGANAVNTILVDFRGFDTMGEVSVLVIAMLGGLGLLMRKRDAEEWPPVPGGDEAGRPVIRSLILRQSALALCGIANLVAIYLLLRGHNAPGGGFIAGLCTAMSLVLLHLALGVRWMRERVRFDPARMAGAGLLLAVLVPTASMLAGHWFFDHGSVHWSGIPLIGEIHAGTPLLFDLGVYFVVVGVTCKLVFTLAQSTHGWTRFLREEQRPYSARGERPIEEPGEGGAHAR